MDSVVKGRTKGGPDSVTDLWWLVVGRRKNVEGGLVPSLVRIRLDVERLTSLLGLSRSFIEIGEGAGESLSLDEDEVGLPRG